MFKLILIPLIGLSFSAHACKDTFNFTEDKQKHAAVSFVLGAASAAVIEDKKYAFGVAMLPGIAKEVYDIRNGCASIQDLLYDAVGAYVGVQTTNFIIRKNFVGYNWVIK